MNKPTPVGAHASILSSLTIREALAALVWSVGVFLLLGTLTALWENPFFIRMTPVIWADPLILTAEAVLLGLYLGLRAPACSIKGASLGGVLGFLGFGCSICNKILLVLFGSGFLLTYFEPVRHWVGLAGIAVLLWVLRRKWILRQTMNAPLDLPTAP